MEETAYALKSAEGRDGELDGYVFADKESADSWMAQEYIQGSFTLVEVKVWKSDRRCGCCGTCHWWMVWRGSRKRVGGAWEWGLQVRALRERKEREKNEVPSV